MSTAFQERWNRLDATKRLLIILTYLAKQSAISIPLADLEHVEAGEGLIQSFTSGNLNVTFAPADTKIYFLSADRAAERTPQWPTPETNNLVPQRLHDLVEPRPGAMGTLTTMDDATAVEAENRIRARQAQQDARVMRGHPLPVPTPAVPPQ